LLHLARPRVEGKAPQALRVAPTPSTDANPYLMGLLNGAEAYLTDPRSGVSVTLAPSVTAIKRVVEKGVFKTLQRGLSIPASRRGEVFNPLNPEKLIRKTLNFLL